VGKKWGFGSTSPEEKEWIFLRLREEKELRHYRDQIKPYKLNSVSLEIEVKTRQSGKKTKYSGAIEKRINYSIGITVCSRDGYRMQVVAQDEEQVFATLCRALEILMA
jgi:hypothetical protein